MQTPDVNTVKSTFNLTLNLFEILNVTLILIETLNVNLNLIITLKLTLTLNVQIHHHQSEKSQATTLRGIQNKHM